MKGECFVIAAEGRNTDRPSTHQDNTQHSHRHGINGRKITRLPRPYPLSSPSTLPHPFSYPSSLLPISMFPSFLLPTTPSSPQTPAPASVKFKVTQLIRCLQHCVCSCRSEFSIIFSNEKETRISCRKCVIRNYEIYCEIAPIKASYIMLRNPKLFDTLSICEVILTAFDFTIHAQFFYTYP